MTTTAAVTKPYLRKDGSEPPRFARHRQNKRLNIDDDDMRTISELSAYWEQVSRLNCGEPLNRELEIVVERLGTKILGALSDYVILKRGCKNENGTVL